MRSFWLAFLVVTGCAWTATAAQESIDVGLLACTLSAHAEAETGAAIGGPARSALCVFKVRNGAQETYVGKVQVVNLSATEKVTLLWRVRVRPKTLTTPGFLEQTYAADPRTPASQMPDLVGQVNSRIILQSMADKKEGSASAKKRSSMNGVGILGLELKLRSTTG